LLTVVSDRGVSQVTASLEPIRSDFTPVTFAVSSNAVDKSVLGAGAALGTTAVISRAKDLCYTSVPGSHPQTLPQTQGMRGPSYTKPFQSSYVAQPEPALSLGSAPSVTSDTYMDDMLDQFMDELNNGKCNNSMQLGTGRARSRTLSFPNDYDDSYISGSNHRRASTISTIPVNNMHFNGGANISVMNGFGQNTVSCDQPAYWVGNSYPAANSRTNHLAGNGMRTSVPDQRMQTYSGNSFDSMYPSGQHNPFALLKNGSMLSNMSNSKCDNCGKKADSYRRSLERGFLCDVSFSHDRHALYFRIVIPLIQC
jgi:hypothetical protein